MLTNEQMCCIIALQQMCCIKYFFLSELKILNVLVACEESQVVCKAFRDRGHNAYSCDIQDCSGGHPEWHIKGDVSPLLNGSCWFETCDSTYHYLSSAWDLIIAHPPCHKLSNCTNFNLSRKDNVCSTLDWKINFYSSRCDSIIFFLSFFLCNCPKVCVENPIGYMNTHFRCPDQIIEPYYFGDPWKKSTCLWLKGLSPLVPSNIVTPKGKWVNIFDPWDIPGYSSSKIRSKTFPGIASAMACQWG